MAGLRRLLESFRPSVVFLELDRQDFARLRHSASASPEEAQHAADLAADAAPELAEVLRWADAHSPLCSTAWEQSTGSTCTLIPVDRSQVTTRRRLIYRLSMQPWQVFRSGRYWGEMPDVADIAEWRSAFQRDCPTLHEVLLEERDEFMAYQILLRLDARLARTWHAAATQSEGGERYTPGADEDWVVDGLQRVAARDKALVEAALRWSLDGPPCGAGGLLRQPELAARFPTLPPSPRPAEGVGGDIGVGGAAPVEERVLVVCGPAHVGGLTAHLRSFLGGSAEDVGGDGTLARQFLARNAALLPHLLANSDRPGVLRKDQSALEFVAAAWGALAGDDAAERTGGDAPPGAAAAPRSQSAVRLAVPLHMAFVHERLRELSWRPVAMWPVFLLTYVVCPALIFIVLPAKFDLYWLQGLGRIKAS